ncbi:MBL fold metallo-hydrolase [Undibacterium sp.]|uniref:MBL fold metallo-hydrolase n=1 Tax=Undibacterium sp. TaxID=1914977 RepID=UPI00374CEFF0
MKKRFGIGKTLALLLVLLFAGISVALAQAWDALGHSAEGARLARMQASPQWHDGHFQNPEPLAKEDLWKILVGAFHKSDDATPRQPVPVVMDKRSDFAAPPASGLRVTWLGHATTLVEIGGHALLIDPIWSERASPVTWAGPKRWYAPTLAMADLPPIDAVLISHDHYDHLDRATIVAMKDWRNKFIVPLGVGAHLAGWGIPEDRIIELDWWESSKLPGLEIVAVPARHTSGRYLFDRDKTLWAGYVMIAADQRVYYSGDTGMMPQFADIGERLGPFDLSLMQIGEYDESWPDWHTNPEQAIVAQQMVKGKLMLPVHHGLLDLAYHSWTEPMDRALAAAEKAGVRMVIPRPGESIEPANAPDAALTAHWWPSLPARVTASDSDVAAQAKAKAQTPTPTVSLTPSVKEN